VVYDGGYDGVVYVGLFEKVEEQCCGLKGCFDVDAGLAPGLFGLQVWCKSSGRLFSDFCGNISY
jgi:hypothetical protein